MKGRSSTVRMLVTLAVLAVVAVGYFAHIGIGNVSALGWDAFSVICPLGYIESLVAGRTFVPRALLSFALVVLLVAVLGRVFCAWVCPFPLLQRLMPGLASRRRARRSEAEAPVEKADGKENVRAAQTIDAVKVAAVSEASIESAFEKAASQPVALTRAQSRANRFAFDSRFGVLIGALASAAIFGFPVFCLICPVGLTFALVFLVMRLFAFGDVTWTIVAVAGVLLAEVLLCRSWCLKFCPLGALLSLISGTNKTLRPTIDESKCIYSAKGKACFSCSAVCPEKLDIRRPELSERSLNNCTKCRECADRCPGHAITFPFLQRSTDGATGAAQASEDAGDAAASVPSTAKE